MEQGEGEIQQVLEHLGKSMDLIIREIQELKDQEDENKMSLFGPFLGRSILELGSTIIISRIDPFRVLLLKKAQSQSNFKVGKPNKSSIHWQGDVLAKEKVNNLWADKNVQSPTRALVGDYYKELIWPQSIQSLRREIDSNRGGEWFIEWIRNVEEEREGGVVGKIRQNLEELYSSLSKGIHHEFVAPTQVSLDRTTIIELINKSISIISTLGLMLNSIDYVSNRIELVEAIRLYEEIQRSEVL